MNNCAFEATHGVGEPSVCGTHAAPYGLPVFEGVASGAPSPLAGEFHRQVDTVARAGKLFFDCLTEDDPLEAIDRQQGTNLRGLRTEFQGELAKIRAGAGRAVEGAGEEASSAEAAKPACPVCSGEGKVYRSVAGAPGTFVDIPCPSCTGALEKA